MGFGVVGTKTFISSSFVFLLIMLLFSFVANPTAQLPFRGYSTNTTLFLSLSLSTFLNSDVALLNPTGKSEAAPACPLECYCYGIPVVAGGDFGAYDNNIIKLIMFLYIIDFFKTQI